MSIGSWTPDTEKADISIDTAWLKRCVVLSDDASLAALPAPFTDDELQRHSVVMRLGMEPWKAVAETLSNEELIALIRFFTVAEERISGWEAGAESPAIWLNKILRQRGEKLSVDMLRWIRANSSNRFIPNGGL